MIQKIFNYYLSTKTSIEDNNQILDLAQELREKLMNFFILNIGLTDISNSDEKQRKLFSFNI